MDNLPERDSCPWKSGMTECGIRRLVHNPPVLIPADGRLYCRQLLTGRRKRGGMARQSAVRTGCRNEHIFRCGTCGQPAGTETVRHGAAICSVDLEVECPFKNSEGVIESDIIRIDVWRGAAETLASAATKNSWIAARGRIQTRTYEKEGQKWTSYGFIAERIEYLR